MWNWMVANKGEKIAKAFLPWFPAYLMSLWKQPLLYSRMNMNTARGCGTLEFALNAIKLQNRREVGEWLTN